MEAPPMLLGDTSGARSMIVNPGFFPFNRQTPARRNRESRGIVRIVIKAGISCLSTCVRYLRVGMVVLEATSDRQRHTLEHLKHDPLMRQAGRIPETSGVHGATRAMFTGRRGMPLQRPLARMPCYSMQLCRTRNLRPRQRAIGECWSMSLKSKSRLPPNGTRC